MMNFIMFTAVMFGGFMAMTNITFIQFCIFLLILKFIGMTYVN
jgi:hypothetical protein